MKYVNSIKAFGFWKGMPYGDATDSFEDFKSYQNAIPKDKVIRHIGALDAGLFSMPSYDIFTGEEFNCGIYRDGEFTFPVDFFVIIKNAISESLLSTKPI